VFDLELATQLSPNEPRYFAALAWARFCRAPDKSLVANQTRAMLSRAIARSEAPVLPHYYLGMVERMMNRHEAALGHFREVLELQPNHQEAATEIRFLTRKY
jgi:cytochrome c-type biogenesis protein CcmH/NrfG